MHLINTNQNGDVFSLDRDWIAGQKWSKTTIWCIALFLLSILGASTVAVLDIPTTNTTERILHALTISLLFAASGFLLVHTLRVACGPWAIVALFKRRDVRAYLADFVEIYANITPKAFQRPSQRDYSLHNAILVHVGSSHAVCLKLFDPNLMNKHLLRSLSLWITEDSEIRHSYYQNIDFSSTQNPVFSWPTRLLFWIAKTSYTTNSICVIFPIHGYLEGTAHERLHFFGSLADHIERLKT